jgi:ABC-2 type transport system ATP-binding protein
VISFALIEVITMENDLMAELCGVSKRFARSVALHELDLQVRRSELFAVLGPNGAGKTTAISLLLGLLRPDAGSVRLFGQGPELVQTRRHIGVMMQEVFLAPELRVREHIDLIASYYPCPLTSAAAMEMTGITSLAHRPYGKLSGGQKRQVQFALAICGRPRLLFLDEPTAGLDVHARQTAWFTLRQLVEQGASIVLTTHYLEEAEALANRVVVLAKGQAIASGTVNEMRALVVRKHICCRSSLDVQQIERWPGVESAARVQDQLHIATGEAETIVQKLLANDPNLSDLDVRRAGLAEAFTQLTEKPL